MNQRFSQSKMTAQDGISMLEILVATILIVLTLVPAIEAMYSGIQGSQIHQEMSQNHYRLVSKMEQVLAHSFTDLLEQADAVADPTVLIPEPYSDSLATSPRRLVFLSRYDADNVDLDDDPFTGTDDGIIWVRVNIENEQRFISTLVSE